MQADVCIIGAGPAGLVTGKVFDRDGFDVTIYDKFDSVGGTWSEDRRYVNLNTQADKGLLEFSDKPNDTPFMDAKRVQEYLQEYATEFGLYEHIQFETEITGLTKNEDSWDVSFNSDEDTETETYDYVVVCSGLHHIPHIPDIPGKEAFSGETFHSCEVDSYDVFRGNDIVSVGFGKSALDMAVEAGRVADSSTLVFREPRWHLPKRMILGTVPYRYLMFSRFGESLLPEYHNDDAVRRIDTLPESLKDVLWKGITADLKRSAGLTRVDDSMTPDEPLPYGAHRAGVYPDELVDYVEADKITPVQAELERFTEEGLVLDTGDTVEADIVAWGTGFDHTFPFLSDAIEGEMKTDAGRFEVYRMIVPPETDNIGFVGLRNAFNNFISMETSAHWLSAYFQEELDPMPTTAEMQRDIETRIEWHKNDLPGSDGFGPGPYGAHLVDELLEDMGIPKNQAPNKFAEYFEPVKARWFNDLHEKRRQAKKR